MAAKSKHQIVTDPKTEERLLRLDLGQKIRRIDAPNYIYQIKASRNYAIGEITTDASIAVDVRYMIDGTYQIVSANSSKSKVYTKDELVDMIITDFNRSKCLCGNRIGKMQVTISTIARSLKEYHIHQHFNNDLINLIEMIKIMPDGLYRLADSSSRKKKDKQPPFMYLKRDGVYTMIDIDENGVYSFTDNVTPDQIYSRATLNFGGTFNIRHPKIT